MPSVLFVCLGNICRSPAAEVILRHLFKGSDETSQEGVLAIDSAAVGHWSLGELPDERQRKACEKKSYYFDQTKRAKLIQKEDFENFDYILAADHSVLKKLHSLAPQKAKAKIELITVFSPKFKNEDVPDPYYLDETAFERVVEILEDACFGFITFLHSR